MKFDVLEAKWKKFKNEVRYHWTQLSSDEVDRINGRRTNLVGLLQNRYGYAPRRAEQEVDRVVNEFEDRLRRAS